MAVYQQYGTGTETETKKKKKRDDDGVGVGTKNTNTNRLSSVVALISTLVAVVLVVIVLSVQASSSSTATAAAGTLSVALSTVALKEANLLRTRTGTNTVFEYPLQMGALLASFTLSDSCDKLTGEDAKWKNACMCLVDKGSMCHDKFTACCKNDAPDCSQRAADIFSSCNNEEEDFDVGELEECTNKFTFNGQYLSLDNLVNCFVDKQHLGYCFRAY